MRHACKTAWATGSIALALLAGAPARAQFPDFSGPWSVSGQIVTSNMLTTVAPVCTFQQVRARLTGFCRGPNAAGPATGLVNGPTVSWQWQMNPTTPLGFGGVSTFRGSLGPDNVIRGSWNHSQLGYASGPFTAQRM